MAGGDKVLCERMVCVVFVQRTYLTSKPVEFHCTSDRRRGRNHYMILEGNLEMYLIATRPH
jgi:hypothetical protein